MWCGEVMTSFQIVKWTVADDRLLLRFRDIILTDRAGVAAILEEEKEARKVKQAQKTTRPTVMDSTNKKSAKRQKTTAFVMTPTKEVKFTKSKKEVKST